MALLVLDAGVLFPSVLGFKFPGVEIFHIDNLLAVQLDGDVSSVGDHFFRVPFADRLQMARLGGGDAIDRAMPLPGLDPLVLVRGVVDDLQFHANIGRVTLQRSTNPKSVVRTGRQLEFQPQHEVGIFLLGIDVAPLLLGITHHVPLAVGVIPLGVADPAGHVFAVEQGDKPLLGLLGLRVGRLVFGNQTQRAVKQRAAETKRQREAEVASQHDFSRGAVLRCRGPSRSLEGKTRPGIVALPTPCILSSENPSRRYLSRSERRLFMCQSPASHQSARFKSAYFWTLMTCVAAVEFFAASVRVICSARVAVSRPVPCVENVTPRRNVCRAADVAPWFN